MQRLKVWLLIGLPAFWIAVDLESWNLRELQGFPWAILPFINFGVSTQIYFVINAVKGTEFSDVIINASIVLCNAACWGGGVLLFYYYGGLTMDFWRYCKRRWIGRH